MEILLLIWLAFLPIIIFIGFAQIGGVVIKI